MISYNDAQKILIKNDKKNFSVVKELLENASSAYYNSDKIILTDDEYDKLYKLYNEKTGEIIIGSLPEGKGTINVEHSYENLVGTLEKCFTFEEAEKWIKEITKKYSLGVSQFIVLGL